MKKYAYYIIVFASLILSLSACASSGSGPVVHTLSGSVQRLTPDASFIVDVTTDSQDLRTICQQMARSIINLRQIANATSPPRIGFLEMVNRTTEDIDSYNLAS